ncbi:hypothetical protein HMPREF3039_01390 [Akkermansia sp. KLE1798]|nr:hypothetical protein HMPREF3039_01390 [Akkermansia sp. KLE1798]
MVSVAPAYPVKEQHLKANGYIPNIPVLHVIQRRFLILHNSKNNHE